MPTYNRRRFVPQAIRYFLRQDYEPKELIIVDDGSDPVGDLAPADGRVRYVRLSQKTSIGAKRNHACEQARGEFILHWDDDDWHAPHRLSLQVEELLRRDADVCGISRIYFFDLTRHTAWQYAYPPTERFWLYGNSLCYRREFWRNHRFADVDIGEDTRFVWSSDSSRMFALPDSSHHVSIIHGENVSTREAGGAYWQPHPVSEIRRIMGEDWDFY